MIRVQLNLWKPGDRENTRMTNFFSALLLFGHLLWFAWPLFVLSTWSCASVATDLGIAFSHRIPYQSVFHVLGLVDTLGAILFPFVTSLAIYFGFRCIANECQPEVIELNRHFNSALRDDFKNEIGRR